jgi:hypothetical protein
MMANSKIAFVSLLIAPVLLTACATRDVAVESLRLDSEAEIECARQCEYVHGGTVRGCRGAEAGATRASSLVKDCVDGAYAALRDCYVSCDLGGQ